MSEKTDAQRMVDDLLSGKSKPVGVFVAGSCEHLLEGACSVCVDAAIAAAEERGRRRGVEERLDNGATALAAELRAVMERK